MRETSSAIWNFFENIDNNRRLAVCLACKKHFSYKTTISNLKQHLKLKHTEEYNVLMNLSNDDTTTINDNLVTNTEDPVYALIVQKDEEYSEMKDIRINTEHQNLNNKSSSHSKQISVKHDNFFEESLRNNNDEPFSKRIKLANKNDIDFLLLKMIIYDFQPFSIVNDTGFRSLVHALNSKYKIPDRRELSLKLLPTMYYKRMEQLKSYVQEHAKFVSITIDCWTSTNMVNHMAITAHFITENTVELTSVMIQCIQYENNHSELKMYQQIKGILENWCLYDKIDFFVSNCQSPNIKGALKCLESDGMFTCLGYHLNEVVEHALEEIKNIIEKVQKVVIFFRKNAAAKESLTNYQIIHQNCLKPKNLLKSFPKQWNSIYLMLERFIELEQPIKITLLKLDVNFLELDNDEWKYIEQICIVIKPFYEAASEMYAETYLVASKAVALVSSLKSICKSYTKLKDLNPAVKKLTLKLREGLENKFGSLELNLKIGLSTVLDPRFKLKPIKNRDNILSIKTTIISKLTEKIKKKAQHHISTQSTSMEVHCDHQNDIPSLSLCNDFDKESITLLKPPIAMAAEELDKYISEPLLIRSNCPYAWWREHKLLYPTLFDLFLQHGNITLNSAPCEFIFSKSGYLINDRRTRLLTSKITQIMFLNANKFNKAD